MATCRGNRHNIGLMLTSLKLLPKGCSGAQQIAFALTATKEPLITTTEITQNL